MQKVRLVSLEDIANYRLVIYSILHTCNNHKSILPLHLIEQGPHSVVQSLYMHIANVDAGQVKVGEVWLLVAEERVEVVHIECMCRVVYV